MKISSENFIPTKDNTIIYCQDEAKEKLKNIYSSILDNAEKIKDVAVKNTKENIKENFPWIQEYNGEDVADSVNNVLHTQWSNPPDVVYVNKSKMNVYRHNVNKFIDVCGEINEYWTNEGIECDIISDDSIIQTVLGCWFRI